MTLVAGGERAVLLHGAVAPEAPPDEQDTLVQAGEVAGLLEALGYDVEMLAVGLDLRPLAALAADPPALVFNLVEAVAGKGQLIALPLIVLEALGVAYAGAPAAAMAATSDKLAAKRRLRAAGLPTPDWIEREAPADGRWIVKSVHEHASIGLDAASVVPAARVAERLDERRRRLGGSWFAERFVEGREFNLSLLEGACGPALLLVAEIDLDGLPADAPRIVDYAAKWDPSSHAWHHTPRVFAPRDGDGSLRAELGRLAMAAWRLFRLRGWARVDVRVDAAGRPWILEVNANPCLAADAGFMAAAREAGLAPVEVIRRIVDSAPVS